MWGWKFSCRERNRSCKLIPTTKVKSIKLDILLPSFFVSFPGNWPKISWLLFNLRKLLVAVTSIYNSYKSTLIFWIQPISCTVKQRLPCCKPNRKIRAGIPMINNQPCLIMKIYMPTQSLFLFLSKKIILNAAILKWSRDLHYHTSRIIWKQFCGWRTSKPLWRSQIMSW